MKRFVVVLGLLGIGACDGSNSISPRASALAKTDGVVISQVYGGGGNGGAVLTYDYVELFNRGAATVSLASASVQYAGDNGTSWSVQALPSTTIDPGQYFLIQLATSNMNTGAALPVTADVTMPGTINMGSTAGKVALVTNTTALTCGSSSNRCSTKATVVDLVGFGSTATDYEGSGAAPTLATNVVAIRKGDGCQDTDDNTADFTTGTWSAGPAGVTLHNQASGTFPCPDSDGGTPPQPADLAPAADLKPPADLSVVATPDLAAPPDLSAGGGGGGTVVISQFYGSGGNSGAAYRNDYIEIFNRGSTDADIGNWSVQYGSGANNFSLKATIPDGTILPVGRYLLIQLAGGSTGSALSPDLTPTGTSSFNMSASDGKIALVSSNTLLSCGSASNRCTSASIVDLVGFGTSSDFEGTAVSPPGTAGRSLRRLAGGCVDSDDNRADFESQPASPRNLASPPNSCSGVVFDLSVPTDDAATGVDLKLATLDFATGPLPDFAALPPDMTTGGGRRYSGCSCDVAARGAGDGVTWPGVVALVALAALAALLMRRRAH